MIFWVVRVKVIHGEYLLGHKMLAFSKLIAPMIKITTKNILESHSLSQIRDAILPKLMNNEIEIH